MTVITVSVSECSDFIRIYMTVITVSVSECPDLRRMA